MSEQSRSFRKRRPLVSLTPSHGNVWKANLLAMHALNSLSTFRTLLRRSTEGWQPAVEASRPRAAYVATPGGKRTKDAHNERAFRPQTNKPKEGHIQKLHVPRGMGGI